MRVFVLGGTGTIGRAAVRALVGRGHEVVCFVRRRAEGLEGAEVRVGEVMDAGSLEREGFRGERFDAMVSCLASRTGAPKDAWAVDYGAHVTALAAARAAGVGHVVLLSAICVQKPLLAFQQAKLAFEQVLMGSGVRYSIVRATAFFKSVSGQVARVRAGRPFVVFGDGRGTACKPISDGDLGAYLAGCLEDEGRWDRVLPIGGPGAAVTPREMGEMLFGLVGREARFREVPVWVLDLVIAGLGVLGWFWGWAGEKAELARIGRYYGTESMLVWDADLGGYDAGGTPGFGGETLEGYWRGVLAGEVGVERGGAFGVLRGGFSDGSSRCSPHNMQRLVPRRETVASSVAG